MKWSPAAKDKADGSYYSEDGKHFVALWRDGTLAVGDGKGTIFLPPGAAEAIRDCLLRKGE